MRRSWGLRGFSPARKLSTDVTGTPLSASRMSPTASSDRAAGLFGKILPTRTCLSGAGWAVTPRNGRRGKGSEEGAAFAAAVERQKRDRRTKKQLAVARFPITNLGECILKSSHILP